MGFWRRFFCWCMAVMITVAPSVGRAQRNKDITLQLQKLNRFYGLLQSQYVDEVDMSPLVESAIKGMLSELDPHSTYLNKEALQAEMESFSGEFSGIGIEYNILNDTVIVVNTVAGGPAREVGVMPNDRIVEVDGQGVVGIERNEVPSKLRGERGSTVQIGVIRKGSTEKLDFLIVRDKIPITTIDAAYKINDSIGYVKVNRFGHTTMKEFRAAMAELGEIGMLILDLRGNGGGLMNQALEMAGYFLPAGVEILSVEGRSTTPERFENPRKGEFDGRVAVLIDESSASASEIVSGAIQDWDRGIIVGRESFGKGLVQRQIPLGDGSAVRLTVARYHTPSGRVIQRPYKKGDRDAYYKAHYHRLSGHERDSLVQDSLPVYKTLRSGRTVYGGGGIRPDVIVEYANTTQVSDYMIKLLSQGLYRDFVIAFLDKKRDSIALQYPTFELFDAAFKLQGSDLEMLIEMASAAGITYDAEGFNLSREIICNQLSAMIAQSVYSTTAFYRWLNPREGDIYKRALLLMENWDSEVQPLLDGEDHDTE